MCLIRRFQNEHYNAYLLFAVFAFKKKITPTNSSKQRSQINSYILTVCLSLKKIFNFLIQINITQRHKTAGRE